MSKIQIAWLEWMTVGGIGGVLILAGTAIQLVKKGKNKSCTQQTKGCVVRYGFPGDGRMYPIVEYAVDGICYRARKEFRGIITKKQSGFPVGGCRRKSMKMKRAGCISKGERLLICVCWQRSCGRWAVR